MANVKQQLQDLRDRIDDTLKRMEEEANNSKDNNDENDWSDGIKDSLRDLQNNAQNTFNNLRAQIDPNYSKAQAAAENTMSDAHNQVNKMTNGS